MRARLGIAGLALALGACGIAYAPGDFIGHDTTTTDGGLRIDGAIATGDGATATPDAATPADTRVMIFGGYRAPLPGETGTVAVPQTMLATISAAGALGTWTFDEPPPTDDRWLRAVVVNGTISLEGATSLCTATFTDHITSAWTLAPLTQLAANNQTHGWLVDPSAFHESSDIAPPNSGSLQWQQPIFDDGGVGAWAQSTATSSVIRIDATIVRLNDFVYALGGRGQGPMGSSESAVEATSYDEDGGVFGNFTQIDPLFAGDAGSVGDAGAEYSIYAPVVAAGAGRLVVAGGLADSSASTFSDVVLAARQTDPTTGALEPWVTLAPLPYAMRDFAMVVTATMIVVFGGYDQSAAVHNEVYGLTIASDGSYGSTWTKLGVLPGGRAGLTAVTF